MEPSFYRFLLTPLRVAPRGFTLVEMLVVLFIIVSITTIAVFGQRSFNQSITLTDTAYTIAFSVREAQSLGLSSRAFSGTQNAGYGVLFSQNTPASFILFADVMPSAIGNIQDSAKCPGHSESSGPEARPGNCQYDGSAEMQQTYSLNRGFTISSFCGDDAGGVERCSGYLDAMTVTYVRPNTQSIINGVRGGTLIPLSNAVITLSSPDGSALRCIFVSKVGQITVGACPS